MDIFFCITLFSKHSLLELFNQIISDAPIEFEIGMLEIEDLKFKTSEFIPPFFTDYGVFEVQSKSDYGYWFQFQYCKDDSIYANKNDSRKVIQIFCKCKFSTSILKFITYLSMRNEVFFAYFVDGNYWLAQERIRDSEKNKLNQELYSVQGGFFSKLLGRSEDKIKSELLNLNNKYPGVSSSRISGYFKYYGNQTMYFGPEFYHFISKDYILNFKDAYSIEQLPNDIIKMQLYEKLEEANDPISQDRQRSFKKYFKMVDHIDQNKIDYEEWPWLKDDSNFGVKIQHYHFPRMYMAIKTSQESFLESFPSSALHHEQDWNKAVGISNDEKTLFISPEHEGWIWIGGECLFNDIKDLYKDKLLTELSKKFGELCSWIYISINDVHEIRWYKDGALQRAIHHCGEDGKFAHKEEITAGEIKMVDDYIAQLENMGLKITDKKRNEIAKSIIIKNMEPIFNSWCPNIVELKEDEAFRSKPFYTIDYRTFYKAVMP